MLLSLNNLSDYKIEAADGSIGQVHSFLFDDQSWTIRYLVVDTATWLPGRKVLLVPSVLGKPEDTMDAFPVQLTREQVKNSPDIDTQKSVSRQEETQLQQYYGGSPYWNAGYDPITTPYAPVIPPMSREADTETVQEKKSQERGDPHLRSTKEVLGYKIHASDGGIGHVEDFLIDEANWTIRYLVVDTRNWLPGKKVIIPPQWISDVQWSISEMTADVPRESIQNSPEFDPHAPVSRDYEAQLYNYYGWPRYWL